MKISAREAVGFNNFPGTARLMKHKYLFEH